MPSEFTHVGYKALINALLEQGYQAHSYDDANPEERHLILRHDIDISLQAAEDLAEIENGLGVAACYFILLRTEMYNPFSEASGKSLAAIAVQGHDIGLHLDASLYGNDITALDKATEEECGILEVITGAPVKYVSFHRPVEALHGLAQTLAGRRHAYEPRFFSEMGYCSDSRGAWHYGHPLDHPAVCQGRAMQLLTHPVWWSDQETGEPLTRLRSFVSDRNRWLKQQLADNCEPYRAVLEEDDAENS